MAAIKLNENFLTDQEVSKILGISLGRLHVKISEGKSPLPNFIQIPGSRQRLWPVEDLREWLNEYKVIFPKEIK